MKYDECIVCWNDPDDRFPHTHEHHQVMRRTGGEVTVLPLGDRRADRYDCTGGGCYSVVHKLSAEGRVIHMLNTALILLIDCGLDPGKVHAAFNEIDEYRLTGFVLRSVGNAEYLPAFRKACRGEDPGELWHL